MAESEEHKRLMTLHGPAFFEALRPAPPPIRNMIPIITFFKEQMIRQRASASPIITISEKDWPGGEVVALNPIEMKELKAALGTEVTFRLEHGRWEDKDISKYYFYDVVMRQSS